MEMGPLNTMVRAIKQFICRQPVVWFGAVILLYLTAVVSCTGLGREAWGDERHFLEQVRSFGDDFSLDHLRDYEEVTPPLTFVVYALWGKTIGFDAPALRVLSLIIAAGVFTLLSLLAWDHLRNTGQACGVLCVFLANPYTAGLSVFVYTDMLMILFLLLFVMSMLHERALMLFLATACGLLTRQYFVFAVLAGGGYLLWLRQRALSDFAVRGLVALIAGILPLAALMGTWHGIAPPSGTRIWIGSSPGYHVSYLVLYVALSIVYLLPIVALRLSKFRQTLPFHALLGILSLIYVVAPVRPSVEALTQAGRETVGLFHRAIMVLGDGMPVSDPIFYIGWLAGLHLVAFIVRDTFRRLRTTKPDITLLLNLLVLAFLLVMPFSYQVWEKYFLPLVPILALILLKSDGRPPNTEIHGGLTPG